MKTYTPMIRQYLEIKKNVGDAILFFRLGDFYEMFFDDAKTAANVLSIALTARDGGDKEKIPMCGVPFHSSKVYIQRLIDAGYKVAIAEQVGEVSAQKGLVHREVVKVITPGTYMEVENDANSFLASLIFKNRCFHVVYCDITTGEMYSLQSASTLDQLSLDLIALGIKEVVLLENSSLHIQDTLKSYGILCSFSNGQLVSDYTHLNFEHNEAKQSIELLLSYLESTQKQTLSYLKPIQQIESETYLRLDGTVKTSLDLFENANTKEVYGSLYWTLNKTKTAFGKRLLRRWLEYPLYDIKSIEARQNVVSLLIEQPNSLSLLQEILSEIYDIERLIVKVCHQSCKPKELNWLKASLGVMPQLQPLLSKLGLDATFNFDFDALACLYQLIDETLVEDIPMQIKDTRYIKQGLNDTLDEYLELLLNGEAWLATYLEEQRNITGIKNLKLGYNKVFGYYLEVTKGSVHLVQEQFGYTRKQTLTNAERYISSQLKERETLILNAQLQVSSLENQLFEQLRSKVAHSMECLQKTSELLAQLDVLTAFARVSLKHNYVRPIFNQVGNLELIDSRHPVLENILKSGHFIPNDIHLDTACSGMLITGPNMGGKSTYLRQVALCVIMSQVGCYVPAKSANMPLFDAIFTRIGANDDVVFGKSTFMVEMMEASAALAQATHNSLIIFDEIGRGTATYDGMAIAQAIVEYIQLELKSKLLFATHYHELVEMEQMLPNIKNAHVLVEATKYELSFLYKIVPGAASHSYGIQVAALAGINKGVLNRAHEVLLALENQKEQVIQHISTPLFELEQKEDDIHSQEIINKINQVQVNDMTPMQALMFVNELIELTK